MQDTKSTTASKRKSDRLNSEEKKSLKTFVSGYITVAEAAEVIGIHRNVLDRVLLVWRAAPETVELIRKAIAA